MTQDASVSHDLQSLFSIWIDHFRYIKTHTWLRGLGE